MYRGQNLGKRISCLFYGHKSFYINMKIKQVASNFFHQGKFYTVLQIPLIFMHACSHHPRLDSDSAKPHSLSCSEAVPPLYSKEAMHLQMDILSKTLNLPLAIYSLTGALHIGPPDYKIPA